MRAHVRTENGWTKPKQRQVHMHAELDRIVLALVQPALCECANTCAREYGYMLAEHFHGLTGQILHGCFTTMQPLYEAV